MMPIKIYDWRRGRTWAEERERLARQEQRWERVDVAIGVVAWVIVIALLGFALLRRL